MKWARRAERVTRHSSATRRDRSVRRALYPTESECPARWSGDADTPHPISPSPRWIARPCRSPGPNRSARKKLVNPVLCAQRDKIGLIEERRPGTNKAHLTDQDAPQLRELIPDRCAVGSVNRSVANGGVSTFMVRNFGMRKIALFRPIRSDQSRMGGGTSDE